MKKKLCIASLIILISSGRLFAQLETEDALPLWPGQLEIGGGLEYQTSKEGREVAMPLSLEYGISNKFTLLIEPVCFTTIHPRSASKVTGFGDLEMTLFYQLRQETVSFPAISVSAEVKLPTARNSLIGTGKTDFTPFLIASKTTGKFFTSVNASYTFLGKPAGVAVNNLFNYALGTIFQVSGKTILFGEVYGNTSALGGKDVPEGTIAVPGNPSRTTEISGGEKVISFGSGYYLTKNLQLSLSVSYDNNHAVLFRPGVIWTSQEGRNFFRHPSASR